MAIGHLHATIVQRSAGQSAVSAAAYAARARMIDARTGEIYDYSRKSADVLFSLVGLPQGAPLQLLDPAVLANAMEARETRKNSQTARKFVMALPHELTSQQREWLVRDFGRENFTRKGLAYHVAIHRPHDHGDQRNVHEREQELRLEAEREDERTIKLDGGRRAYVDGKEYRDAEGNKLTGTDRAQAELHHLDHPDATTWQEHENLTRRWEQTETLKAKIEGQQDGSFEQDAGNRLTAYEKQLQAMRDADLTKAPALPDYGRGDYATEMSGLISTYKAPKPN